MLTRISLEGSPTASRRFTLEEIVSFCKKRGVIFPGSSLYGAIGTGFDYGPLGAQLKKNIQDLWWKDFVERRPDCVGLESSLIMNPKGLASVFLHGCPAC
jgi:glycyl-tRNA synthetase